MPLVAERSARILRLDELDELVEREAEQVAQADQLAEARRIRLGVGALRSLRARRASAEQAELLVVADGASRDAHAFRHLADAQPATVGDGAHAAFSTVVSGTVASTWWYLPPRSSEASAATRHAPIANTNA